MQIVTWIIAPAFLLTILVTVYLHYRRKKRDAALQKPDEKEFLNASPEQVGYTNGEGEYVLFDHSTLIQEYKHRLSYHHARTAALQQDLEYLAARYDLQIAEMKNQLIQKQQEIKLLQQDLTKRTDTQAPVIPMHPEHPQHLEEQNATS